MTDEQKIAEVFATWPEARRIAWGVRADELAAQGIDQGDAEIAAFEDLQHAAAPVAAACDHCAAVWLSATARCDLCGRWRAKRQMARAA